MTQTIISVDLFDDGHADEAEVREISLPGAAHGKRIDQVLAQHVPEFSRSYLQQLMAAQAVQLNGVVVTKQASRVKAGQHLRVELRPTAQSQAFQAEPMDLNVLFEDEHILVVHKPAGLVVHPAAGHWSGTLLNGLLARNPQAQNLPRAGIVHRLDKDTSGVMVVANSRIGMESLTRQIASRSMRRQYWAWGQRDWQGASTRTVEAPIGRDPRQRLRMAVVDLQKNSGKTARTDFKLMENKLDMCLVQCALHTGRTHQIRVHMAHIGHPLVGDSLYGGKPYNDLTRQALHAAFLTLTHPVSGETLQFHAPLPEDLQRAFADFELKSLKNS